MRIGLWQVLLLFISPLNLVVNIANFIKVTRQAMYYNGILTHFRVYIVAKAKQYVLHILSVSVALVIKHAKRTRMSLSLSYLWPVSNIFFSLFSENIYRT
jgi:hypothetical protein